MNNSKKIIIYTIVFSLGIYLLDAIIDFLFFYDKSFFEILITGVPTNELYNRILSILIIVVFSILLSGILHPPRRDSRLTKSLGTQFAADPDTRIISNLTHQLKTPLNAIVGFSDLLKDPGLDDKSKATYVNHINSSGRYLIELLNNVVDISKLETKSLKVKRTETRVNKILDELCDFYLKDIREQGKKSVHLSLNKDVSEANFTIISDPGRLKQVFTNLLRNAIRYTDKGTIEFGYHKKNDRLEFYVKDTGSGFSKERLAYLLSPFSGFSGSPTEPFDTAGLRINIVRGLVQVMGGGFDAESNPGKGSEFKFTLPYERVDDTREPAAREPSKPPERDLRDQVILIAEDVESNYIYLQEILRPTKAKLIWAKNGEEAVDHCTRDKSITLVLMDILMPEMDGYEAAGKIKQIHPDLPVVAQTAYSLEGEKDMKNFDDVLTKPIWSKQLLEKINKILK